MRTETKEIDIGDEPNRADDEEEQDNFAKCGSKGKKAEDGTSQCEVE